MSSRKYTFRNKPLPLIAYSNEDDTTYSLISGRKIKGFTRAGCQSLDIGLVVDTTGETKGPYIYGETYKHLMEFFKENGINTIFLGTKDYSTFRKHPIPTPIINFKDDSEEEEEEEEEGDEEEGDEEESDYDSEDMEPQVLPKGLREGETFTLTSLKDKDNTDVGKVNPYLARYMSDFTLDGYEGKALVSGIISGDRIRILIYVTISVLSGNSTKDGFFAMVNVKILGIDSASQDTPEGMEVIERVKMRYSSLKDIVWVRLSRNKENGGQLLAKVYEDEEYKIDINTYLTSIVYLGTSPVTIR
jgi:hypothetical protein